jgi:hypothetical protein
LVAWLNNVSNRLAEVGQLDDADRARQEALKLPASDEDGGSSQGTVREGRAQTLDYRRPPADGDTPNRA